MDHLFTTAFTRFYVISVGHSLTVISLQIKVWAAEIAPETEYQADKSSF